MSEQPSRALAMLRELQLSTALDSGGPPEIDPEGMRQRYQSFLAGKVTELSEHLRFRNPDLTPADARAAVESAFSAAVDRWPAGDDAIQIPDPIEHELLRGLIERFEAVLPALGLLPPVRPIFGSVPLGQSNARTHLFTGTVDDPHLIVFQEGA